MTLNLILLLGSFFLAATFTTTVTDEADVRAVIKKFASAGDTQNAGDMQQVLHPEAQQFFMGENGLVRLDTPTYLGMIEQKKIGGQSRKLHIQNVDVNGNMATAKAALSNDAYHFDNYISLMKVDGAWQIMSIVLRMEVK